MKHPLRPVRAKRPPSLPLRTEIRNLQAEIGQLRGEVERIAEGLERDRRLERRQNGHIVAEIGRLKEEVETLEQALGVVPDPLPIIRLQ
jgi:predicted RNase H-like nuclease (RuvC/YqgF family)